MKTPPSQQEIDHIINTYNGNLIDLIRKNDSYQPTDNPNQFLKNNPQYLQRPLLVTHEKTTIGRPTEQLLHKQK